MPTAEALVLGVDPGSTSGGAVLLDHRGHVLAWWSYAKLSRKGKPDVWRLNGSLGTLGYPFEVGSVANAGLFIGRESKALQGPTFSEPVTLERIGHEGTGTKLHLCLEGLFVPRANQKQAVRGVIALAESAGQLEGAIGLTPRWRPLANEWRHVVLGLRANTKAEHAEQYAVENARHLFTWPEGKPSTKAELGAIAEAACLAQYGWAMLKQDTRLTAS